MSSLADDGVGVASVGSDDWKQVVYSFLEPRQLCRCALVSQAWRAQTGSERLWVPHFNALPHAGSLTLGLPRAPRPSTKQRFLAHVERLRHYESNPTTGFAPPELCRGPSSRSTRRNANARHGKSNTNLQPKPHSGKRRAGVDGSAAATLSAQFRAVKKRVEREGEGGTRIALRGGTDGDSCAFSYALRSRSRLCGSTQCSEQHEPHNVPLAPVASSIAPPSIIRVAQAHE